ncbi:20512_t:CDS:2 [Gigaspora margarita]|uniref:20512_t:CDS:1 n=1 Tax=Gigaspora margarita TaxID=4874 RepID=A0ABN7VKQ0_GIGMA|nr:20512_t:CDS:2 [Gigaspora margarita]
MKSDDNLNNILDHDEKENLVEPFKKSDPLEINDEQFWFISQNEYFYDKKCVEELNEYHERLTYRTTINEGDKIDEKNLDDQINVLRKSCSDDIIFAEPNKTHEFQSLLATKKNEADLSNCITFRMNEIDMLNDSIKNVKLQLQELRNLEQKSCHSEKDLKQVLESLRILRIDHCQLKEEWRVTNAEFRKEYFALYNFHKFGERNGDVRCMNGVRA